MASLWQMQRHIMQLSNYKHLTSSTSGLPNVVLGVS
jgi:hypothetical protein